MRTTTAIAGIWLAVSGAALASDTDKLKGELTKAFPKLQITEIKASPVGGVYEVSAGSQIFYATADGKYLFTGDLIDIAGRVNLSDQKRERAIVGAVDKLGEDKMIVIGPKNPKHVVTVFTDIDCPYCQRFHQEVPALTNKGVKVRYIFYPRAGVGSESYKKSVAVWCAKDRGNAIGVAKAGGKLDMKSCDNPVGEHFELAQTSGISGTPAIILDNGNVVPGYVPAEKLLAMLDEKKK